MARDDKEDDRTSTTVSITDVDENLSTEAVAVQSETKDSKQEPAQIKGKMKKNKKQDTPKQSAGLYGLFRYATAGDYSLMTVGLLASLVNGAALPYLAVLFGRMTNLFVNVATQGFAPETSDRTPKNVWDNFQLHSTPGTNASQNDSSSPLITRLEFTNAMASFAIYYIYVATLVFVAVYIQTLCWELACERQVFRLRQIFFAQILRQDISWYDANEDGDLPHKLADDLERVREGIGSKFSMLSQYSSTFLTGLAVGFHANARMTTAMIILAPLSIGLSAVVAKAMSNSAVREQIRYGLAGSIASEALNSIKTVASFGGELREIKRYGKALEEGSKITMGKYYVLSAAAGMMFVASYGAFAFAFWFGARLIQAGEATPGSVFTVFFSVMTGAFTVGNALPFVNAVGTAIGSASTIFGIIDRTPDIDPYSSDGLIPESLSGKIAFRDVGFSYPTRNEVKVLDGLSLEMEEGKSVGVVGASGSGKSTLVGLLLRFYTPDSGTVTLDGRPLQEYNLQWLRAQIGLVSQEPVLFGVSIAENIRYGREGVSELDILNAAKLANAHCFIKNLPRGYETRVGDKGCMLSGGQKQRLAIARALIRNPKILLLDEATSALDTESEGLVQTALETASRGRSSLIIAHRLSTVRNVSRIYALKDGKVFESGSHDELMAKEGLYYSLITAQAQRDQQKPIEEELITEETDTKEQSIPLEKKKSGFFSRISLRRSRKSSGTSLGNICVGSSFEEPESKEELAKRVSFLKIFKMNLSDWPYMVLTLLGCGIVGASMPIFSSFYADVFHTYTLTGAEFDSAVMLWTGIYIAFALLAGLGNFTGAICSSILTERMIVVMRQAAFTSVLRQQIGWFDAESHSPARLVTSLASDPPLIKAAAGFRAGQIWIAVTALMAGVTIAFSTNWKLSLVLMVVVPLVGGAAFKQAGLIRRHQERDASFMTDAGQIANECVLNIKTVQALGKEKLFLSKYKKCLETPFRESKKQAYVFATVFAISQAAIYCMYAAAFRFGSTLIARGETDPVSVFRVFFALSFSATAIGQASTYFQDFAKAKLSIGFVYRLMQLKSDLDVLDNQGIKPTIEGDIEFSEVEFAYPSRPRSLVLRGLSLRVGRGQTVALVGASGCGKSTLIALLQRFYTLKRGHILIDGVDISKINLCWLRRHMGLVTQEPVLFDCSIRENIAYGALTPEEAAAGEGDGAVSDEAIIAAARTANIHTFISSLPQGYDTAVGERGAKLSGGQRQRLAIARALIRNPKILLLDEATSALDTESEKVVQEALDKARQGRTSLVIAHRLSTVRSADLIAVLDRGRVAELGTHQQLKSLGGLYYQLVKDQ